MTSAFVRSDRRGAVALLTIDRPPVNSLSRAARLALWEAIEAADADAAVTAVVITGAGRGFCAGGELSELRSPLQQAWPGLSNHLFPRIEQCTKPVIAAMHGFAIGGGLELALACHYRVAEGSTRVALPEMKHGVLPPSGSQRLPRAIGVEKALDLIVPGHTVRAEQFAGSGLFDRLCDEEVVEAAVVFAASIDARGPVTQTLLRHRPIGASGADAALAAWRERLARVPGASDAMHACIDAVAIALNAPDFDAGLAEAKRLHDTLAGLAAQPSVGSVTPLGSSST